MKYKLINTNNPIIISDEQPVVGWYYDTFINSIRNTNGAEYGANDITKQIIAGIDELPSIDFSELSIDDRKKIGYTDVREMSANFWIENSKSAITMNMISYAYGMEFGFIGGFEVAQSLNDKQFNQKDMLDAMLFVVDNMSNNFSRNEIVLRAKEYIQQQSKPKIYDIEIETVCSMCGMLNDQHKLSCKTESLRTIKPKITNNSIKITAIL